MLTEVFTGFLILVLICIWMFIGAILNWVFDCIIIGKFRSYKSYKVAWLADDNKIEPKNLYFDMLLATILWPITVILEIGLIFIKLFNYTRTGRWEFPEK